MNWTKIEGMSATYISSWGKHTWAVNKDQLIYQLVGKTWVKRPGKAVKVSVGQKGQTVWVLNQADEIYSWNGEGWDRMPGALIHVSVVNENFVWGVNRDKEIFHWDGGNWHKTDRSAVSISVGKDEQVWIIDEAQQIFKRDGFFGKWEQVEGALTHVSVFNKNTVAGNNAQNEVFLWRNRSWEKVEGRTTVIAVGKDNYKSIWGINASQEIFHHQ